jgi:hypothetical protein
MFHDRVAVDRDNPSPEPLVYLFIHSLCMSAGAPKRSPPTYGEKHKVTLHGAPRRQKAYIQWNAAWFPKGIVNDTAVSTPVPCSTRHDLKVWCVLTLLTPASIIRSKSTMSCYVKNNRSRRAVNNNKQGVDTKCSQIKKMNVDRICTSIIRSSPSPTK